MRNAKAPDWKAIRRRLEPLGVDLSDYSDEFVLGFVEGAEHLKPLADVTRAVGGIHDRCCGKAPTPRWCVHDFARAVLAVTMNP